VDFDVVVRLDGLLQQQRLMKVGAAAVVRLACCACLVAVRGSITNATVALVLVLILVGLPRPAAEPRHRGRGLLAGCGSTSS
jgi:hypothetical protein